MLSVCFAAPRTSALVRTRPCNVRVRPGDSGGRVGPPGPGSWLGTGKIGEEQPTGCPARRNIPKLKRSVYDTYRTGRGTLCWRRDTRIHLRINKVQMRPYILACALAVSALPLSLQADPNKDESGKAGKVEEQYQSSERQKDEAEGRGDFDGRDWNSYDDWVRDRSRRDRSSPYFRGRYSRLDIPYGHYPPPGECRLWYPNRPPGQQPPPRDCRSLRSVPRGAWLIRRPHDDAESVYISARGNPDRDVFDVVGIFEAATGRLIREIDGR